MWLQVFIDTESVSKGTLVDAWRMLPEKEISVCSPFSYLLPLLTACRIDTSRSVMHLLGG